MAGVPEARDAEIAEALDGASKEAGLSAEMSANLRRNVLGLRS
ncbi:MAG: hypothetical protein N4A53_08320 [Pelagimonas sp.]|jgi:hypothetical protein|nr:hypothetical protein [Pelagimonas sp.]